MMGCCTIGACKTCYMTKPLDESGRCRSCVNKNREILPESGPLAKIILTVLGIVLLLAGAIGSLELGKRAFELISSNDTVVIIVQEKVEKEK